MGDLYGTGQAPAMTGSPEEISSFLTHFLHGGISSQPTKFSNPTIASASHPPHAADDVLMSSAVNLAAGYRFELPDTQLAVTAGYSDGRGSFGKERMEIAGTSKRRGCGSSENELGDFSCDSEGPDGVDAQTDAVRHRSSSKRSRTAEIHNLSEKRRRSRINEKMKALQNLIPNSNKTDKASMLDEAIEYLKQLQLKVQMLTMRNGLSLHPLCLPGGLQPMQLPMTGVNFEEGNDLLNSNRLAAEYPSNVGNSGHTTLSLPNQCTISNDTIFLSSVPSINHGGHSFGFEPLCPVIHYEPLTTSSPKELCKEGTSHAQLDADPHTKTSSRVPLCSKTSR